MTDFILFMLGLIAVLGAGGATIAAIVFGCKALDHYGKSRNWWKS